MNIVVLQGVLTRDAEALTLPSGDRLVRYEVTVRPPEGRAESVPVSWLDPPARTRLLPASTEVVVIGRVRRRFFRAAGATGSRTEVAATTVVAASRPASVERVIGQAVASLTEGRSAAAS